MAAMRDLTGLRSGRLVVLNISTERYETSNHVKWNCLCDCGNIKAIRGTRVSTGEAKSCGQCSYSNNRFVDSGEFMTGYTTKGEPFLFDHNDAELITPHTWHMGPKGYIRARIGGKYPLMHRHLTQFRDMQTDHINGIRHDNRRSNLRPATNQMNIANSRVSASKKSSKYKGVFYEENLKKYRVVIGFNRQAIRLGRFSSEDEAALVYDQKAKELFGEYAKTNF